MTILPPPRHHSRLDRRALELRSDTFKLPTHATDEALRRAPLGDDVYGEDPTVSLLNDLAAEQTGKEATPLVTGGTQGNRIALLPHCPRGRRVAA